MTATLEELTGSRKPLGTFEPCATYNDALHWLIWLDEDVSYVSKRVHPGLELLHHPQDDRIIGFKILDPKELFEKAGMVWTTPVKR